MRRNLLLLLLIISCKIILAEKIPIVPEPQWLFKTKSNHAQSLSLNDVNNGYYIELVDHQVNLGAQTEFLHAIRHIANESGVQNASEVSVAFAPEFQRVVFHKLNLWRGDKIISQLRPEQIKVVQEETDASDFQYNGLKRAFVIVHGVQKEDRIEFSYSIIGFNPVFGNLYSDKIYFANSTLVERYFETIIVPADRSLAVKTFNGATTPEISKQGDQQIYHWNNPPVKLTESQPDVPLWFDNYPYIAVSEFNNWKDVIDWGVKLFQNYQYPITADLKKRITQWRELAQGDKDLFTNMAIRFVQDQVRYLGLEIGSYTHKPHAPGDVYRRRFGDCKDKALLLATILQQESIPAYVALVNTTTRSKLAETAPSASAFDHAIVAIQRSSGYIYIDATIAYQRGEIANVYIPDYGYALVLREGQTELQPIEPGFLYRTNVKERLIVTPKDSCRLFVNTVYIGGAADFIRSSLAETGSKDLEDTYRNYYIKNYEGIKFAKPIVLADDSSRNELTVTEDYIMPSLWHDNKKGNKSIDVFSKAIYEQLPDPSNAYAGAPVAIPFPREMSYELEISMPENWSFPTEGIHIKNNAYRFDFTPEVKNNLVTLRYYYKTFKDHIPPDEVAQYKNDYKKIEADFDFSLFYSGVDAGKSNDKAGTAGSNQNINFLMVFLALLFSGGLTLLLRYFNRQSASTLYNDEIVWPLGGWVIVLGITLGLSVIVQIFYFSQNGYFNLEAWKIMGEQGGVNLQFLSVIEMAMSLLWICGAVGVSYWFIQRRDIFPRMFIGYVGSLIAGQFLLLLLLNIIPYPDSYGDLRTPIMTQLFKTGVYGAIWVSYVLRSERVKSTFLYRYR